MAITKGQKVNIVKELEEKIDKAKSVVFAKYKGVNANDINDLRGKFKETGSEYIVAKKTLVDLAFSKSKIEGVQVKELEGEVATILGYEDEVAPAKILDEFAKEHQEVEAIGGVLENKFIDADKVKFLASLPSKPELYARIVGSIKAPISGLANVLVGNLRGLVTVLKKIEEQK